MRPTTFPWLSNNATRQDEAPGAIGGIVELFTAAAALNTGDAVFFSAANTVNKSVTQANYAGFVGIVVGGALTNDNMVDRPGVPAANANQRVFVSCLYLFVLNQQLLFLLLPFCLRKVTGE